jgi:predicted DNA-binding protein
MINLTEKLPPLLLTKEQKDWLKEQAKEKDRAVAWIVRDCINRAMKEGE